MIKISRFSNNAFQAQEQSHHFKHLEIYYNDRLYYEFLNDLITWRIRYFKAQNDKDEIEYLTEKTKDECKQKKEFCLTHLDDFKRGIWVFWKDNENNVELNHFKNGFPIFNTAELPENTECYDVNWEEMHKLSDSIMSCGTYIPERELYKLQNVKINVTPPKIIPYDEYWNFTL